MYSTPQIHQCRCPTASAVLLKTRAFGRQSFTIPTIQLTNSTRQMRFVRCRRLSSSSKNKRNNIVRASIFDILSPSNYIKVKADVKAKITAGGILSSLNLAGPLDALVDIFGLSLRLELASAELDANGSDKALVSAYARPFVKEIDEIVFKAEFNVPQDFGDVGAILVTNELHKELYFTDIVLKGFPKGTVNISCNSWVHSRSDSSQKRIFFTNKSYLPSETPGGIKKLRSEELQNLRGNGTGERKTYERIYDYDVYNDLGDPDKSEDLKRPVLGGKEHPYPRRCRTGRPPTKKDPLTESRSLSFYVPRDEAFSDLKSLTFNIDVLVTALEGAVGPALRSILIDKELAFPSYNAIDDMYDQGLPLPKINEDTAGPLSQLIPKVAKLLSDTEDLILHFDLPELIKNDKFSWLRDEEFARETLAGVNPMSVQLLQEFPIKSKLDPHIYGPAESAITKEIVESQLTDGMTVEKALEQKRLFIIDYHDFLLPYVNTVRELEGTTLYGSRALFYSSEGSTLKPIAIELTKPPTSVRPQWKQAFTPGPDKTKTWLWILAKLHFLAHESGYHQLVIHWLRTHCCTEPYIIASNRQLSAMHPIYRLLHPHFRYTMKINALARQALINAGGTIEISFSPLKYSILLSSVAYDKLWRFDTQALPADLISRGMAVEDPTAEHGLKLAIEDYPFANDGLLIWSATKEWVTEYVNRYYADDSHVSSDEELQAWWTEIRTKGHADKQDEPWWPTLRTIKDLIHVLCTIIWVSSGHHASINFSQYPYAGYFPNRPSIARLKIPIDDEAGDLHDQFMEKPDSVALQTFPSQIQAALVTTVLDVLSSHSPDEEYIGDTLQAAWKEDGVINVAYKRFNAKLKEIESIMDARNKDPSLKNRTGPGAVPYKLLKPFSGKGVTGEGVPNSISI